MTGLATLRLENVSVCYGPRRAVDGLTLEVRPGEIVGLLGPNGSGKSTTMAVAAGALDPRGGRVEINGLNPWKHRTEYAKLIGYVPQEIALYDELNVRDNLCFFGRLFGIRGRLLNERAEAAAELVGLTDRYRSRLSTLSGGMQRRVNLACALIHEPAVILLDEPAAALDPDSRQMLYETLNNLRAAGRSILFTTHHLDEAEQWCDRIAVLQQGRLLAVGRPEELRQRTGRMVIVGRLRDELSEIAEATIRDRLSFDTELTLDGRSFELVGADAEAIGYGLAVLQAEGADVESFRTPATRLEQLCQSHSDSAIPAVLAGGI
ncbi:ABC transporter ATP-binding protein [Zavarzinella formosa]|uniref:ABC transporter ATP-binding protein n=1 Tax=Zavarzinella formosa TaxID=360055 RepID=UPI00031526C8|nr:ABC transporter ATP-binding protein [Zavarzinella formosa]